MTDHKTVAAALKRYWPQYDVEALAADMKRLADVSADELAKAIEKYRDTDTTGFPPPPGKLRELCGRSVKLEAKAAWDRVRSLKPIPVSSDIGWYNGSAQRISDDWAEARKDPRVRAGLEAIETYGGLWNIGLEDLTRAKNAFAGAFQEEDQRLELASGQKELSA